MAEAIRLTQSNPSVCNRWRSSGTFQILTCPLGVSDGDLAAVIRNHPNSKASPMDQQLNAVNSVPSDGRNNPTPDENVTANNSP